MSPIRGLTDNALPALLRLGILHKGGAKVKKTKVVNGQQKEYFVVGPDLDTFRFTSSRPEVQAAFEACFGPMPAMLHVYLLHPTPEGNFSAWKEKHVAGGMVHRCDGETMVLWRGPGGKMSREPKPCPYAGRVMTDEEKRADPPCKEVGRLEVLIPELVKAGFTGTVTVETHSINDIVSIQSCLLAAGEVRGNDPLELRGIPFVLRREKRLISTPGGGGGRAKSEKSLIVLEPASDWMQLRMEMARQQTMAEPAMEKPAEEAAVVDETTGEIMDGDFEEAEEDEEVEELEAGEPTPATPQPAPQPQSQPTPKPANGNGHSAPQHGRGWPTWSKANQAGFIAECKKMNLDEVAVHEEFGVKSRTEITLDNGTAMGILWLLAFGWERSLTIYQIREALGVAFVGAYTGGVPAGRKAIDGWINRRTQRDGMEVPDAVTGK